MGSDYSRKLTVWKSSLSSNVNQVFPTYSEIRFPPSGMITKEDEQIGRDFHSLCLSLTQIFEVARSCDRLCSIFTFFLFCIVEQWIQSFAKIWDQKTKNSYAKIHVSLLNCFKMYVLVIYWSYIYRHTVNLRLKKKGSGFIRFRESFPQQWGRKSGNTNPNV